MFRLVLCLALPIVASAQTLEEAVARVADRIAGAPRVKSAIEVENLASLPPSGVLVVRRALESALGQRGVDLTADPAAAAQRIRITISENARGPLLVAEFADQVAMAGWRAPAAAAAQARMTIRRTLVLEQAEPILDFLTLDGGDVLVLEPQRVVLREKTGGDRAMPLTLARPLPRDPRGRIEGGRDAFHITLPGTSCDGAARPELKLTCKPGGEPWAPGRNYLSGSRGNFYSAAGEHLFAGLDGRSRLYDRGPEPVAVLSGWGSDIASLDSACGAAMQIIVSGAGESEDQIQAYEIAGGQVRVVSEPLPLPGPVTALWPASLVLHNLRTGNYEASRLAMACAE